MFENRCRVVLGTLSVFGIKTPPTVPDCRGVLCQTKTKKFNIGRILSSSHLGLRPADHEFEHFDLSF